MGKNPARKKGRKPKLDPELVAAAIVELDGNVAAVARKFGVDRTSVRDLIGRRPSLARVLHDCREGMKDNVEERFYADCLKDSPAYQASRIFFLKTQGKDRGYVERHEFDDVGDEPLSDDVRERLNEVDGRGRGQPSKTGRTDAPGVADAATPEND